MNYKMTCKNVKKNKGNGGAPIILPHSFSPPFLVLSSSQEGPLSLFLKENEQMIHSLFSSLCQLSFFVTKKTKTEGSPPSFSSCLLFSFPLGPTFLLDARQLKETPNYSFLPFLLYLQKLPKKKKSPLHLFLSATYSRQRDERKSSFYEEET